MTTTEQKPTNQEIKKRIAKLLTEMGDTDSVSLSTIRKALETHFKLPTDSLKARKQEISAALKAEIDKKDALAAGGDDDDLEEAPKAKPSKAKKEKEPAAKKAPAKGKKGEAKEKKPKDPLAPKGPKGAFLFFTMEKRASIKASGGKATSADLSELWKNITPAERAPYDEQAAADKQRYNAEMQDYIPGPGFEKKKKEKVGPKKGQTAFFFFLAEFRARIKAEGRSLPNKEVPKEGAAEWNALSEEDKLPYNKKARADKQRYDDEMAALGLEPAGSKRKAAGAAPAAKKTKKSSADEDEAPEDDAADDDADDDEDDDDDAADDDAEAEE